MRAATPPSDRRTASTHRRPDPVSARRVALEALVAVDSGGGANAVVAGLLAGARLASRDRHLVTELVYGTCRMRRACDWLVDRHARGRVDPETRAALRLGAYQIGWTRIPAHAAVSATVAEVSGRGRSLVNAVLRKVAADAAHGRVAWPDRATELSYPDWLYERLMGDLGFVDGERAMVSMNEPAKVASRDDGYRQDPASQMVVAHVCGLLQPPGRSASGEGAAGVTVLDLCAAPGGKATGIAGARAGVVIASDVSERRARVVRAVAGQLGSRSVLTVVADGRDPPYRRGSFDLVLVDAPCSGLGALRRRPDARWRIRAQDVDRLRSLQTRLLGAALGLLRPGGVLAYSVCTMTRSETVSVDEWLALSGLAPAALPAPGAPWRPAGRGALLLPQDAGTDGMFLLCVRAPQ